MQGAKAPLRPCGVFTHLFGSVFHVFSCACLGVQGDGKAVPLHKYNTAVTRRLHESEDGMSQAEKTKNVQQKH